MNASKKTLHNQPLVQLVSRMRYWRLEKNAHSLPAYGTARYAQLTNYRSQNFKFRIVSAQNL